MENIVSIVNTRENELEFDISVQGVATTETDVKFVIEASPIQYGFVCNKGDNDKWTVKIPSLKHLAQVAYPFHLEVVIDGYYFEPYRGTVNVTAEPEVKSGDVHTHRPAAPTVKVTQTDPEPKEEDEEEFDDENLAKDGSRQDPDLTTDTEDDIGKLADILLQNKKERIENEIEEPKNEKDRAISSAIADFMKKPFQSKKKDTSEQDEDDVFAAAMRETESSTDEKIIAPRKSNLNAVIKDMNEEPELSDQALKVRAILSKG